jgi:hypothetical protein
MEQRTKIFTRSIVLGATALSAAACGSAHEQLGSNEKALVAACTDGSPESVPEGAWICPEARTVECTSGTGLVEVADKLYVDDSEEAQCADKPLSVSDAGPFAPGEHEITVSDDEGNALCAATLTVTDSVAPTVEAKTIQLWPPNHKFHSIAVSDCVSAVDACQGDITGEFIWASSDEPVDDRGDGHHSPDILIDDCGHVQVRAERQGPKDGRVYKLGVRVVDGAGNVTESECAVIVDHDQRGVVGADSGESYRITLDGTGDTLACDGITEDPTDPPSGDGDGDGDGDSGDGDGDGDSGDGDGDEPVVDVL